MLSRIDYYIQLSVEVTFLLFYRLQTVRRVDQDFDIRRVQTAAEKYIPINRCRRKNKAAANYSPVSCVLFMTN